MVEPYKIIRLKPEDYHKGHGEGDPERTKRWYDQLVSGNRITFVYTENGEFIGEGSLLFEASDPDYTIPGRRIYLSRLVVKNGHRGRGIGGIIVDYLVDYAKRLGYREMSIGVDIDNVVARHLYEKKGFTEVIFEGEDEAGRYVKLLKKM